MITVELFSGTGSFSKVAKEKGHNIFRVELESSFECELNKDILELQREELPKKIDVLWASPPCTTFSVASLRHYWVNGKPKNKKTWIGISMILKTLDLISEIRKDNPNLIWFIENPRGMLRKQSFMNGLNRKTISYCQYGDFRQKPTDIWTNLITWDSRPMCSPGSSCHESAKRGSDKGTQNLSNSKVRSIIPPDLFKEIFNHIGKLNNSKLNISLKINSSYMCQWGNLLSCE